MAENTYKEILERTFIDRYSLTLVKEFLDNLEKKGLIKYHKRQKVDKGILDTTSMVADKTKLAYAFENVNNILKECEEFEYTKGYRYIYLSGYSSVDISRIPTLIEEGRIKKATNDDDYNDRLNRIIQMPTFKEDDKYVYLKFSLELKSSTSSDSIKQPVLCIIHKNMGLLEIRQDDVPTEFNPTDKFYNKMAIKVIEWLRSYLNFEKEQIDMQSIIRYMKNEKQDDIKVTALKLKKDGTVATVDAGSNPDLMLPLFDDIKRWVDTEKTFNMTEETKACKEKLLKYLIRIEEVAQIPAAKVLWIKENYLLQAIHGELEGDLTYLKWVGSLTNREGIDYAIRYIMQCEKELAEQFEA